MDLFSKEKKSAKKLLCYHHLVVNLVDLQQALQLHKNYFRKWLCAHDLYDLSLGSWLFGVDTKGSVIFSTYAALNLFFMIQDADKFLVNYLKVSFEQFEVEAVKKSTDNA